MTGRLDEQIQDPIDGVRKPNSEGAQYVDLAPTDKADPHGIYSAALLDATKNANVFNIALTGPYGSGKSSIIKSFLKKYKRFGLFPKPALQISLASFLPEAESPGGKVTKQEIERSILQQMLYGADANKLPLSRFKRIKSPRWWSSLISLFVIFGLFSCWHLTQNQESIFDGSFFQPFQVSNWLNILSTGLAFCFIWYVAHQIYIKSLGVSIKSISLKDVEITPDAAKEESILNRHLDEIIYFFQSTKYDLVIVEDLDRFNNPDIFVTLREINSLVNANSGVKRQIRFLYALRDNMFSNTERTKFFEFIVPVIPIINSSNSIDKVIEQGRRLSLDDGLDRQFLREVSRFLNDLRLIQNIFNEYAIYVQNLETDHENYLDPNKLLAVLIYKNVLPSDFESLHREKGKLANILSQHDDLVVLAEERYRSEILELESQIADAEKQLPGNLEELRKIYAMSLVGKLPQNFAFVEYGGDPRIPIQTLWNHPAFDQMIEERQISFRTPQNHVQRVDVSSLQAEVDPEKSYQDRKQAIEHKTVEFKSATAKTISDLRSKRLELRMTRFNKILQSNSNNIDTLFEPFGENRELVRFLVMEGFLDDTYYQYTSLFHSGRLSPNDNKFLIQIRAFNTPEPDFQIDNPKEVIAAMREDDFRQSFVLNVILVDCLLANPDEFQAQIEKLKECVSKNFVASEPFLLAYYQSGKHIPQLLSRLLDEWPGFVSAALQSSAATSHIAMLIAYLPEQEISSLQQADSDINEFMASSLSDVLATKVDIDPKRLTLLDFQAQDMASVEQYPAIARSLADVGMYKLSKENIEFVYHKVLGGVNPGNLNSRNYTTILESENTALIDKVQHHFNTYLEDVLLMIEGNVDESVATILRALKHEEVEVESLAAFLGRQLATVPHLVEVPPRLHDSIFDLEKIDISWANCLAYLTGEASDEAVLTDYLSRDHIRGALAGTLIDDDKAALPLRQFILNNNGLDERDYRVYVQSLPRPFNQFPKSVDPEKWLVLIEEGKVSFSPESFEFLSSDADYQALFVARNFDAFYSTRDKIEIDDEFREQLLTTNISDEQRLEIVKEMDLASVVSLPSRATIIGELFYRSDADVSGLSEDEAEAIIVNTQPVDVQVSLLNKCQKVLSDSRVRQILLNLPRPFSEIKPGYRQPTIDNTDDNVALAEWLEARSIISSWKETFFGDIRIYNFRR